MTSAARLLLGMVGLACLARAVVGWRPRRTRTVEPRRRLLPALLDRVVGPLERIPALRRPGDDPSLARRLALAPRAWPWRLLGAAATDDAGAVARLAALRACTGCAGVLLGGLVLLAAGAAGLVPAGLLLAAGVAAPDVATASAARAAERRLVAALPDLLETLAAALEAGLVLEQALHLAAEATEPPLRDVLRRTLSAIRLREPPGSALRREAERCGVPALSAAAATVERGRRLGDPVAPALLAMAADARSEAVGRAALHAARRSSAAALVVALVIVPACVVGVLAAIIGGLLSAGHGPLGG